MFMYMHIKLGGQVKILHVEEIQGKRKWQREQERGREKRGEGR